MKVTLGDFINNIEKNGYEQAIGALFKREYLPYSEKLTFSACALGQGFLNIFGESIVNSYREAVAFNAIDVAYTKLNKIRGEGGNFGSYIITLNDEYRLPLPEIAKQARKNYADQLDTIIWEG